MGLQPFVERGSSTIRSALVLERDFIPLKTKPDEARYIWLKMWLSTLSTIYLASDDTFSSKFYLSVETDANSKNINTVTLTND